MSPKKTYHSDSENPDIAELERARAALKASMRTMATLLGVDTSTYEYWIAEKHKVPEVALVAARGLIAQHRLHAQDVAIIAKVKGKGNV